jgi:hypothetical protein
MEEQEHGKPLMGGFLPIGINKSGWRMGIVPGHAFHAAAPLRLLDVTYRSHLSVAVLPHTSSAVLLVKQACASLADLGADR